MDVNAENTSARLLAALVVKRGAGLGTLTAAERELALAIAASALPALAAGCSEAEANRALQRCLQAEAAFLATDHVELRRWLVDSGHWRRDGYGRCYERVPLAELPLVQAEAVRALDGLDLPAWVATQREMDAERRDARRQAWAARSEPPQPQQQQQQQQGTRGA